MAEQTEILIEHRTLFTGKMTMLCLTENHCNSPVHCTLACYQFTAIPVTKQQLKQLK